MLTQCEIEANPEKCQTNINMRSPTNIKEMQHLVGRLTSISRFLPKLAEKTRPMVKLLKKSAKLTWDDTCQQNFDELKQLLTNPPILNKPNPDLPLVVYISASANAINVAIVQEVHNEQQPIYFISRILQDPETCYQMVEKVALSVIAVIAWTDCSIQKILQKPDLAGRLSTWSIELSEFNICCESRGSIKAQCLPDFTNDLRNYAVPEETWWTIHEDDSSNPQGIGADIVLEGPCNILIEQSLHFKFKTSKNQAEYEAIIVGLNFSREVGAKWLVQNRFSTHSGASHRRIPGERPLLSQYYHTVTSMISQFNDFKIEHIPRANNIRADLLSKLANTKKKDKYKSLLQQTFARPSIEQETQCMQVTTVDTWMEPFLKYLQQGTIPENEEKGWMRKVACYTLIGGELFRRGFNTLLLKCIPKEKANYVMQEIHEGICGYHSGPKTMSARILRADYY